MGKPRHNNTKPIVKQGLQVGDKHESRTARGTELVRSDREINREDYNIGWFHPTQAQNEIIRSMLEKPCTLVDSKSGCGKSTTVIYQALKMLKTGEYEKIVFIKTPTQLGVDDVGFLGTNEAKFDYPLAPMRGIFESFMSKEKLAMEEKRGKIEFLFPNWLGGATLSRSLILVDEFQWFTPEMAKLVLERADDTSKVVCMFDSKQRYASKQRPDGAKDLLDRVTKVDESGVRYVTESLFGYVKMDSSENRRGALSKRVTEIYDDLDFDKSKIKN